MKVTENWTIEQVLNHVLARLKLPKTLNVTLISRGRKLRDPTARLCYAGIGLISSLDLSFEQCILGGMENNEEESSMDMLPDLLIKGKGKDA